MDLAEHLEIGGAIQAGRFVNGIRNGIEEALLHHIAQRSPGGVNQNQAPVIVDEAKLGHQDINRSHAHEGREHPQNQRGFHQGFPALELEPGDTVGRQDGQEGTQDAAHGGDKQGVKKPPGIIIHGGIRKQFPEALQRVPCGEESLKGVNGAGGRKGGQNQPQAWEEENKRYDQQKQICNRMICHGCPTNGLILFHR